MKRKTLSVIIIALFCSSSIVVIADLEETEDQEIQTLLADSINAQDSKTDGIIAESLLPENYEVNNLDKIGRVGDYTNYLAQNFDLGLEIIEKRTPTARHFKNDDDSFSAIISVMPTSYPDEEGIWQDIDSDTPDLGVDFTVLKKNSGYYGKICKYEDFFSIPVADPSDTGYKCWVYNTEQDNKKYNLQLGQDAHHDLNPLNWDDMQEYWRCFAEWDTSSIPDNSDVFWLELFMAVSNKEYWAFHDQGNQNNKYATLCIERLTNRPSELYSGTGSSADKATTDPESNTWTKLETLFEDIDLGSGDYIGTSGRRIDFGDSFTGEDGITLGFGAEDHLENQLDEDWFAVGFKDKNENEGDTERNGGVKLIGPNAGSKEFVLEIRYVPMQNYAVIVGGGRGPGEDPAHETITKTAYHAKQVFKNADEPYHIEYMINPDKSEVRTMISGTIPLYLKEGGKVALYFVGHSSRSGTFQLNKYMSDSTMTPSDLDSWIDTLESNCNPSSVVVMMETCYAGKYISPLSKDGRMIITSTDEDSAAFYDERADSEAYFSEPFLNSLSSGNSYATAWEAGDSVVDGRTRDKIRSVGSLAVIRNIAKIQEEKTRDINNPDADSDVPLRQNPLIDDNGDGVGSGTRKVDKLSDLSDGDKAKTITI